MHEIDFLPAEYRKKNANRHTYAWRLAVMTASVALLAGAALVQNHQYRQAQGRHAAVAAQYNEAATHNRTLGTLQSAWETARADAELFTYLRHPWPRTQVLTAILNPLPEPITLERLEIRLDTPRRSTLGARLSREEQQAVDETTARLAPAARDLRTLREQTDSARTLVVISGITRHTDLLHQYLGQLGRCSLVAKTELDSLEIAAQNKTAENGGAAIMKFAATIVLRPGYGQPGGPVGGEQLAQEQPPTDH